jgi:hypothetical protein
MQSLKRLASQAEGRGAWEHQFSDIVDVDRRLPA